MLPRKALLIPAVASVGLLAVLGLTGWGGSDSAAPSPSSSAPRMTTQAVSIVPTVDAIVVKTTTTTPPPPTTTTTVASPPPRVTVVPVPPSSASETPDRGLIVVEGAPCRPEGAIAVSARGKPLVCRKNDNGKLRWEEA